MQEVIVTGRDEGFDFYESLRLEQLLQQQEEERNRAFAPPAPVVLPEVPVIGVPGAPPPGFIVTLVEMFGRLFPVLMPQPSGPRDHDELDPQDQVFNPPPKPPVSPPTAFDPLEPPNWDDLIGKPGSDLLEPVPDRLVPYPELPEFVVSPPKVITRPSFDDEVFLPNVVESPFDYGISARPGPAPAPFGTPGSDPIFEPFAPDFEPRRVPQPDRPGTSAPDLFGAPLPDIVGNPFGDPFSPSPLPTPPGTKPGAPTVPDFFVPESPVFTPNIVPEPVLTGFKGDPTSKKDQCDCAKKKKKKKRDARTVCYRGTYVETKKGLSKKRLEEIPCEDKARAAPKQSTGSSKPRTKKPRPGAFPGLGLIGGMDGGQVADLASQAFKEFAPILMDYFDRRGKKAAKATKKRNRKPKTRLPRLPGTPYSSPFPYGD